MQHGASKDFVILSEAKNLAYSSLNQQFKKLLFLSVSLCLCGLFLLITGCSTNIKGKITPSENPYDLAIDGEGFFIVDSGQGGYFFTRSGSFMIDSNRFLVTKDGYRLAPTVQLPEESGALRVTLDGVVYIVDNQTKLATPAGTIRLAVFPNPGSLDREGNYLLPTSSSGEPVTQTPGSGGAGTIKSGFIEK